MSEKIYVKTDDGAEIEAEVTKKTVPSVAVSNEMRDFKVGDYVIIKDMDDGNNIFTQIVKNDGGVDRPYKINGYELEGSTWVDKEDISLATQDEINIRLKYTKEELELRDEFAKSLLCNNKIWWQHRQLESTPEAVYRIAEEMLEARKKLHS